MESNIYTYTEVLASKAPVPGGGGAAALCGAIGAALAEMVCSLTLGKPRYAQYEAEIKEITGKADILRKQLTELAEEDEVAFEPLSRAYSLPNGTDEEKAYTAKIMEECLLRAADVPFRVVKTAFEAIKLHEKLVEKGSKLAISDVGVGAVICKSALQSAALNVYINTKYMEDKATANEYNSKTDEYLARGAEIADGVYKAVYEKLR